VTYKYWVIQISIVLCFHKFTLAREYFVIIETHFNMIHTSSEILFYKRRETETFGI